LRQRRRGSVDMDAHIEEEDQQRESFRSSTRHR
jgi:hypothetical protein